MRSFQIYPIAVMGKNEIFKGALFSLLAGCSANSDTNCFELSSLNDWIDSGECRAQGYLVKEFEDYFLNADSTYGDDFVLVDFVQVPGMEDQIRLGQKYSFSGRFQRLEGDIFRLEVKSPSDLVEVDS